MAEIAYKNLTLAEQIFKALVWDNAIKALKAYVTFLSWPIISQIVDMVADAVYASMVLFVDIQAIRLVNSAHQSAYDKESLRLNIVSAESGVKSKEFEDAKNAAKIALSKFVHIGP